MDIIEQIEIPSFERKNANFRRNFAIAAGCVGLLYALEQYNGSVSRTWKSVRRGVTAAIAAWIEDHGGFPLFPLEGEDSSPLSHSGLDLNGLCAPRLTHGDGASAVAAAYLTQSPQQQDSDGLQTGVVSGADATEDAPGAGVGASPRLASADTPNFFQSTKFFACLDVDEARELFRATRRVSLAPHEVLFRSGDPSDSGIYIVLHGTLGVFLEDTMHNTPPIHANTLRSGESVGDLDVVDGAERTVSCMALESGCLLVNVPRVLFMEFVRTHPRALMLYLQQGLARLWRVAHFVLADFLQLQLYRPKPPGSALAAETAAAATAGKPIGRRRSVVNMCGQEQATQTDPPADPASASWPPPSPPGSPPPSLRYVPGMMSERGPAAAMAAAELYGGAGAQGVRSEGSRRTVAAGLGAEAGRQAGTVEALTDNPVASGGIPNASAESISEAAVLAAAGAECFDADGEVDAVVSSKDVPPGEQHPAAPPSQSSQSAALAGLPYPPYHSPHKTGMGVPQSPSEPTFNELLASTAASARARGAGGPTHGPLHPEAQTEASTVAAAAAAAALLAHVPASASGADVTAAAGVSSRLATEAAPLGPLDCVPCSFEADGAGEDCLARAPLADGHSGGRGNGGQRSRLGSCTKAQSEFVAEEFGGAASADCSTSASSSTIGSTSGLSTASTAPPASSSAPIPVPMYGGTGSRGLGGQLPPRWGVRKETSMTADDGPRPQGPVCRLLPSRSQSMTRAFVLGERACLAAGWDVIDVEELGFDDAMWASLSDPRTRAGTQLPLAAGGLLQDVDWASGCFYLLVDGHLLAERRAGPTGGPEDAAPAAGAGPGPGGLPARVQESALIAPGSLVSCAAFLSSTASRCKVVALEPSRLVAFSWQHLEGLLYESPDLLIRLLVAASAALGPVIRRFISLGLNRVWLESGDVAYRQGDFAECLYVVISGRLRLLHETIHPVTHMRQLHLEEEVGRGEAVGAVWAITGGHHDTTALCVRDSELVRMSRSAFRVISADSPLALSKLFSNIARRLVAAWDSRVRSDRGAGSSNAAAGGAAAAAAANAASGAAAATALQQLPNPARLGLTPLKSAGQLNGGGVVRGPRPSARRGEIVTIAILPAGVLPDSEAAATMTAALSGSPTDVAAASAALAAAEAASMGVDGGVGSSGTGHAGSFSALAGAEGMGAGSGHWKWPPGLSKQAAALATMTAMKRLSGSLKNALSPFGPVLLLDATVLSLQFPIASERLDVLFYRSKVTSWMAAQEEEYRFILLEGDVAASPWSSVCVAQADCILLVAPEGSSPQLSQPESLLVFNSAFPAFARPKPVRSGLTPAAASATMTPSASSAHLAAAAAAAAGRSPAQQLRPSSSGAGPAPAAAAASAGARLGTSGESAVSLADMAEAAAAAGGSAAGATPAATTGSAAASGGVPGGVGGSYHPHHQQYGLAQMLYGASSAAMLRRVELVFLHQDNGKPPAGTAEWLSARPNLSRHHHIRLNRPADIQRLARWMAGKTVGIVLSGGGSRGLAHLGVLTALEDAGVPLDVVGGTSQGAFMAALYAQGLDREALNHSVRHYAQQLGSVRHLLSDITLPVLSLFSGTAFDQAVRRVFERGAQRLEDLWLPFFCVTTNLTRGEASVHTEGLLWKLVRASMTIVGLLPPVWEDGCLLVDGGYMNNMPVDVMRSMMGVESVIVVDVEGRDDMGWRSLTPYDGGLSGWRLLWDRLCPFPRWRSTAVTASPASLSAASPRGAPPRYAALINKLTAMTHTANLKRVAVEHRIDLYLRPPGVGGYRLMDYHLMDRIVKDAYRYAATAISQWKTTRRVGCFGIEEATPTAQNPVAPTINSLPGPVQNVLPTAAGAVVNPPGSMAGGPATPSVLSPTGADAAPAAAGGAGGAPTGAAVPSCMTQLQKKQKPAAAVLAAVTASVGGSVPPGGVPFVGPPGRAPGAAVRPALRTSAGATGGSVTGGSAGSGRRTVDFAANVAGGSDDRPSRTRIGGAAAKAAAAGGASAGVGVIPRPMSPVSSMEKERDQDADAASAWGAQAAGLADQAAATGAVGPKEGPARDVDASPPRPLRSVMSKMTRSGTKHSLLDLT